MAFKKKHFGPKLDDWLAEEGIREEVTAAAMKRVLAEQIKAGMKEKRLTKKSMAEKMGTSRAQLDRLLDPGNESMTIHSLAKAASVLGKRVEIVIR